MKITEAAKQMGVSSVTVRRYIQTGRLVAQKIETGAGFYYHIEPSEVEKVIHRQKGKSFDLQNKLWDLERRIKAIEVQNEKKGSKWW